jgi:hypothetical protein
MPRDGAGTYSLPSGNPVSTGTTISSTTHNSTESDIATALSASLCADGQKTASADQPMGTNKHTNVGNAAARNQYAAAGQVQDGSFNKVGSVAGTDTITGSLSPAITSYSAHMVVVLTPANNNTGATTLALNGLAALDVQKMDGDALISGDLVAGVPAVLVLDTGGDDWILLNPQTPPVLGGDTTANVGYLNVPQNEQSGNYTLVLSDSGKHVRYSGIGGHTLTIPANASVAYPIGTAIVFVNTASASITIAITSDTLILAGTSTTGSRTLGANGLATALKVTSTAWIISGTGLS